MTIAGESGQNFALICHIGIYGIYGCDMILTPGVDRLREHSKTVEPVTADTKFLEYLPLKCLGLMVKWQYNIPDSYHYILS
jgi:hypothetical protein